MTLPRDEIEAGAVDQYASFERLVRPLGEAELNKATRCEGWTVGDVAAHVIGQLTDITQGRFDGLGTPEVTDRQVNERKGHTGPQLADELATATAAIPNILGLFDDAAWNGPAPAGTGTMGDGVEALWFDTFTHHDDIASALGDASPGGDGLKAAASHIALILTDQAYPASTLALDGLPRFDVSGGGPEITGDPFAFMLAATGRGNPQAFGLDETVNIYR